MNFKTISVVAMSNRDFPDLEAKLREAGEWVRVAANQGSQLVIFPEFLNQYCGDGPNNPRARPLEELATSNWRKEMDSLIQAASTHRLDLVLPVLHREEGRLYNSFFLLGHEGKVMGRYDKIYPTRGELDKGVVPGKPGVIDWRGIKVGGAICFDTNFEEVFQSQAALGARMFIVSSLWPGGSLLPAFALKYLAPICLSYPAWSRIIDIDGAELAAGGYRLETLRFGSGFPVYTARINFDRMVFHGDYNAVKMEAIEKKHGKNIRIHYSQIDARWMIESISDQITVSEIAREFDLLEIRDYLRSFVLPGSGSSPQSE